MARRSAATAWSAPALVTEGKEFPDNSLIVGAPAKVVRTLDARANRRPAPERASYVANAQRYKAGLKKIG
jgi:carbonic anhydrase/acetyltransferase-like protein (isoleucine patch superfamily)